MTEYEASISLAGFVSVTKALYQNHKLLQYHDSLSECLYAFDSVETFLRDDDQRASFRNGL